MKLVTIICMAFGLAAAASATQPTSFAVEDAPESPAAPARTVPPDFEYFLTGNAADVRPQHTEGALMLMGGGGLVDDAFHWFIQKAGSGDIVVLKASDGDSYGAYLHEKIGGCDSVETIAFYNRDAATDPKVLRVIQQADGVFLACGAQWRYADYWKGTPVGTALDANVRGGTTQFAQSAHRTSACSSTSLVASSCRSGG